MSGVKRTRQDESSTNQSQTTTNEKIEPASPFFSSIEEDYNW